MRRTAVDRFGVRTPLRLTAVSTVIIFGILLSLVEARWEPLQALDRSVAHALNELVAGHPGVVAATRVVTDLGGGATWWILLSATTVHLLVRGRPRLALFVAVTGLGGGLLNRGVKAVVGVERHVG